MSNKAIGNCHYELDERQTKINVTLSFEIPLLKEGGRLTEAQFEALKAFCNRFVPHYIDISALTTAIAIKPCEVYHCDRNMDNGVRGVFDADTGELFTPTEFLSKIMDGHHEIRTRVVNPEDYKDPEENG